MTILKLQPNKATLKSDPTQAVKIYGEEQRIVAAFLFTGIFQADKPREFEGRAVVTAAQIDYYMTTFEIYTLPQFALFCLY